MALALFDHECARDILRAGIALRVLEHDLGRNEVLFVHQLLQEYFAARRLAQESGAGRVRVAWRADAVVPDLRTMLAGLADSDPLPLLKTTGWEETAVLAAALAAESERYVVELMEANLPLAGRSTAQPDVLIPDGLKERVRWSLVERTRDPAADLRARIAAGMALGELGDPRFERCSGPEGDYLLPPMVAIAGGVYRIGSDGKIEKDEAPIHPVEIAPFDLGRFPVTNAEWRLFMVAGGYEDERWWETEAARAWRRGESTAEGVKQEDRNARQWCRENYDRLPEEPDWTSQMVEQWRGFVDMSDEDFEKQMDEWYPLGRQTEPAFWNDEAYNNPLQPVVGICWYEARAYCAWLSAQTGQFFRLPTEAEWESAARGGRAADMSLWRRWVSGGRGREYAYGDRFDAGCCNTFESHICRPMPVGVFPGGDTSEGLVDMTGNVWEWTSSLYESYLYRPEDGRENPEGEGRRVVRGGGWGHSRTPARAASRNHFVPYLRYGFLGIRLARPPP